MGTIKQLAKGISKHWLTIGFVLGFITDVILLNRVDDVVDNIILLVYVVLATVSFLLLYVGAAGRGPQWFSRLLNRFAPMIMQYAFGGLLSGMLIFYGRSGDWIVNAPFLLLILGVIFGNELLEKRSSRLVYHLTLYFIGLFSYVVLVVPVVTGRMGDVVFVLSGLVALLWVSFVVQLLYRIVPRFMSYNTKSVILTIGFIYIGFNVLYFTNLIPPIPLSLTELSVVHSVESSGGSVKTYRVVYEEQPWYRQLPFVRQIIHPPDGSAVCFARVYTPTRLQTEIFHRWERKNNNGEWITQFRFGYDIAGTNKGGYRGYTRSNSLTDGLWRCSVETERGQVLGREVFVVDTTKAPLGTTVVVE